MKILYVLFLAVISAVTSAASEAVIAAVEDEHLSEVPVVLASSNAGVEAVVLAIDDTHHSEVPVVLASSNAGVEAVILAIDNVFPPELPIIDTAVMGKRRTNLGCHVTLYPMIDMALAVNCHPYDPTVVLGDALPSYACHPLVAKYDPATVREILPAFIRARLDAAAGCQLYLNVQDNPWKGTPIQLRAHAFSDFFPAMGGNYAGVTALVCRGDGTALFNGTSSVHLHGGVASPSNFAIAGLNYTHTEDFYSIVAYGGRTVITRHILLTVPVRENFQDLLCAPAAVPVDRSLSFFSTLLGSDYATFLGANGVI